jgi:hypothetical protein
MGEARRMKLALERARAAGDVAAASAVVTAREAQRVRAQAAQAAPAELVEALAKVDEAKRPTAATVWHRVSRNPLVNVVVSGKGRTAVRKENEASYRRKPTPQQAAALAKAQADALAKVAEAERQALVEPKP